MTDQVNKDLLIAVMGKRQEELEKMIKVQADQLNNYREYVGTFNALVTKYEQDAAAVEKTAAQYKHLDELQQQKQKELEEALNGLSEENNKLTTELEELKLYARQLEQKLQAS